MPAGYLLDTNFISEIRRRLPNPGVAEFFAATEGGSLFISVLTLGELRKGVMVRRARDAQAADRLAEWVDGIEANFAERVLPIDAIPDVLPVLGFTDDAAVLAIAIKLAVSSIRPEHKEAARERLANL